MDNEKAASVALGLREYAELYDDISTSVFSFISMGTRAIVNIDAYVLASMASTLKSMATLVEMGSINDAYALARKLDDAGTISVYVTLYLERNREPFKPPVEQIDDWLTGKKRLPSTRVITSLVSQAEELAPVRPALATIDKKALRDRCNDHSHHNFFSLVLLNDGRIHHKKRTAWTTQLGTDVRDVVILHLGYLFCICPHYMLSSDYRDALEMDMAPDADSDTWVAPGIQEFVSGEMEARCPGILRALRDHTGMMLEHNL